MSLQTNCKSKNLIKQSQCDYDTNAILLTPLQNREADSLVRAWKLLYTHLTATGHTTSNCILDNEISGALRDTITAEKLQYKLVPSHQHRHNAAKHAICTFKN